MKTFSNSETVEYKFLTVSIFNTGKGLFLGLRNIYWYRVLANLLVCSTKVPSSKKRSKDTKMFGLGSTITATHWPRFIHGGIAHILPRPYHKCKPGQHGWIIMQSTWFQKIAKLLEDLVFQYLNTIETTEHTLQAISDLKEIKSIVPECLRIASTIFTQLTITTSNGKTDMETHVDDGDIICSVLHLGDVSNGGSTIYFDPVKNSENMKETCRISFEHGRIQIGFFDKVYHCVESFEGIRYSLNFNSKRSILKHFQTYGWKYYNQYINNNYEGDNFLAR